MKKILKYIGKIIMRVILEIIIEKRDNQGITREKKRKNKDSL